MRKTLAWKLLLVLAALTLVPLRAQTQQPPMSTGEQMALLNKIQGVSSLKFGASLDSFDKSDLKSTDSPNAAPSPASNYLYTTTDQITWGTLVPSSIGLTFFYDQLVGIQLHFNESNAALIPVFQAFVQKYGWSPYQSSFQAPNPPGSNFPLQNFNGPQWQPGNIIICVALPQNVPPQSAEDFLTQKVDGGVMLYDIALVKKLTQQKEDAMRNEVLKGQNLDKIKADL